MPGKIKVKVLAGRNLPVMDRAGDTTDAFVEIKFGGITHKTDVCRKSLNPHWNSTEWYRFEVDESELQDEPLQLRLMDHDTYSANDAIGKVVISLAPLLARDSSQTTQGATGHPSALMSGWIPVFDTMHGIRGELNVIVKVELFSDFNKYKTSSCGVQFFHCPMIPPGYKATAIHGFVEELVVNDDPEYQWIDKIRTPRASNEARQVAFIKLSNEVQRLVGLKAAELGANAVVGYQQDFDLEGEAGVVARAIGTAVSMVPLPMPSQVTNVLPCSQQELKKYLDILVTDNETIGDLNQYFKTHQEELQKLLNILHPNLSSNFLDEFENVDDDEKSLEMTRQLSVKSYTDSVSVYQDDYVSQKSLKHILKDQTDLNKLLNQQNEDNEPDSPGPLARFKSFRNSLLGRKTGSIKSRKQSENDDQVSLKSTSSDTSKISLRDIKNEFKKLKRLRKPKIQKIIGNDEDEGLGMASILARSVIHAHTTLARISESHDSEHSATSTLIPTSESDQGVDQSGDEKIVRKSVDKAIDSSSFSTQNRVPEIRFSSLENVNIEQETPIVHRKLSISCPTTPIVGRTENVLNLPKEDGYYESASSALSGESSEIYSSSDDDDEESDTKTEERWIETTSSVVESVLKCEVNPSIVAQMDKKLNNLEKASSEPPDTKNTEKKIEKIMSQSKIWSAQDVEQSNLGLHTKSAIQLESIPLIDKENNRKFSMSEASTSHGHSIKFHNPFSHKKASKSISAPCSPTEKNNSFVYRQSKKIKKKLSQLSHSNLIKSVSHSFLTKKKEPKPHNSSGSDVPSKDNSHETVLGSPFLSYTDLLSLDKESDKENVETTLKIDEASRNKIQIYIGSEPPSRCSFSVPSSPARVSDVKLEDLHHFHPKKEKPEIKPIGLVHTAMATILMDKVQSLLIPTSPEPTSRHDKEKIFFDDVNKKLEKYEESKLDTQRRTSTDSAKSKTSSRDNVSTGLVHTAMETILMDKVQSLLIPMTPEADKIIEGNFEFDLNKSDVNDNNQDITGIKADSQKKLIRQNSVHSSNDDLTDESSTAIKTLEHNDTNILVPCQAHKDLKTPVLQHFHPILSNIHRLPHLETIPSLPESSSIDFSQTQSLDESKDLDSSLNIGEQPNSETLKELIPQKCGECTTNIEVGVCDNSHAACRGCVRRPREERDKEREKRDKDREKRDKEREKRDREREKQDKEREREKENEKDKDKGSPRHLRHESCGGREPQQQHNSSLNATSAPVGMHRRSSDSDLSVTPKGGSQTASGGNAGASGGGGGAILRPSMNMNNLEMLEYPFLTMTEYPPRFIVHIGGTVCARSVKLLDSGGDSASRATWWAELRTELRANARSLRCHAVLGYCESTAICEDVCVLSASGTAAVINLDCDLNADSEFQISEDTSVPESPQDCTPAHAPYSTTSGPYRAECSPCGSCRRARVPSVLLVTCSKPKLLKIPDEAKAVTVTAAAARVRRAPPQSEPGARDISDQLPFLEYELQKLLLAKLRMQGANALFSLHTEIALGERCVAALASGTAIRLNALPPPVPPRIKASEGEKDAVEIQRALLDTFAANKVANGFDVGFPDQSFNNALAEIDDADLPAMDLCSDKDACILELDEAEDVETARSLAIRRMKMQVFTNEVTPAARAPPLAFAQVFRARLPLGGGSAGGAGGAGERHVARTLDAVAYKLRTLKPFALATPRFQLDLPDDEIQLIVSGTAIRIQDPAKLEANPKESQKSSSQGTGDADEAIFAFDEEQPTSSKQMNSELDDKNIMVKNGQCPTTVALTTLSRLAGAKRQRFVCALQLLFVRETTSVRELGGFSGFLHTFMVEVLAIVRAHTAALGGNALTSFYVTQLMLQDNAHKNQGQCLLSVGGDVVNATY